MDPRRLAYIVITMVTVATFAMLMLNNMFEEVPKNHKNLILFFATIFSGLVAYLLFPKERKDEAETVKNEKDKNSKK